ncbi:MAG: hypothetical protein PUK66_06395 [Bacteroidales bacterium]|uniref:hypothetical protein n=1 Tax=Porphyromonas sp. TaxID=1924944 RepID=UPI00297B7A59|nr:hypothetical protein [Porphyromonas sp.]MDD7438441.1 hypothetical protein [Bacteroidales bacterium]MDY3066884.1 hypothetical protein [Porphyromonas sp.]
MMKKILFAGVLSFVGIALLGLASCAHEEKNSESATTATETEMPETTEAPAEGAGIDALLANYDQLVTTLSETALQVKKKDLTAVANFPQLLAEAQDLQNQLEQEKNQMNTDQQSAFQKISAKMAQAITDAQ